MNCYVSKAFDQDLYSIPRVIINGDGVLIPQKKRDTYKRLCVPQLNWESPIPLAEWRAKPIHLKIEIFGEKETRSQP